MNKILSLLFLLCMSFQNAEAQRFKWLFANETDPAYITDLSDYLTLKLYGSRKLSSYNFGERGAPNLAKFSPNDYVTAGVGFAYKWVGLNVGFRIPNFNLDESIYGKTKILDFASYFYLRKYTFDVFAQFYDGYYRSNNGLFNREIASGTNLIRPDLKTRNFGINGQYIFNNKKFSYRAAFIQGEWQRKSSGSFILGAGLNYYGVNGDSSIIDRRYTTVTKSPLSFDQSTNVSLGVNIGYAYTLVLGEHWFVTAAVSAGPGIGYTALDNQEDLTRNISKAEYQGVAFQLNGTVRVALGYNSERWFTGVYFTDFANRQYAVFDQQTLRQQATSGLGRLVFAYRIPPQKRMVQKMDDMLEKVEDGVNGN